MNDFVRERITRLRLNKGVSEYQMSYDLGHSKSYINNISSGKVLPSLNEFFSICEYFHITPAEFFDTAHDDPALLSEVIHELKSLDDQDIAILLPIIRRMHSEK